jgi:hypothetical protein
MNYIRMSTCFQNFIITIFRQLGKTPTSQSFTYVMKELINAATYQSNSSLAVINYER